jgi:tRNA(fMet)-specific endonuclease VapC
MSGDRYLLDTNAIIALLQGNSQILQLLQDSEWIGISIISQLEFLSFSGLTEGDRQLFDQFLERIEAIGITPEQSNLIELAIQLRQKYRLPIPDVIIAVNILEQV